MTGYEGAAEAESDATGGMMQGGGVDGMAAGAEAPGAGVDEGYGHGLGCHAIPGAVLEEEGYGSYTST